MGCNLNLLALKNVRGCQIAFIAVKTLVPRDSKCSNYDSPEEVMRIIGVLCLLLSLSSFANIVRYKFNNIVYVVDSETGRHHKVMLLKHDEIRIVNGCLVQYRDRLFYSVDPKSGKATRVSLVNHENIEPISGCVLRYSQNNTVYYVQPENGRAYKVALSFHDDIGNQ